MKAAQPISAISESSTSHRMTRYFFTLDGGFFFPWIDWKDQQAVLWARVKEATKGAKRKWRVGDLLADERCSPAVLDFLQSTYVGRAVPPVEENWDSGDEEEEAVEANEVEAEGVEGRAGPGSRILLSRFVLFCFVLFSCVISFDRLRYFPWVLSLVCFISYCCV